MSDKISSQWSINMRPTTLKQVYGMDKLKTYMYNTVKAGKGFPTAILLQGQFGAGKTTIGEILAAMMVCQHPDAEGNPCGECPSCKAIFDEKWNRDVIQIDGGQAGKSDIIDRISSFVETAPFKDKAKIVMLEEVQELSSGAKNSMLKLLETRRPDIHYIFTSMEDLKSSGLTSRCTTFKFPFAKIPEVMMFLKSTMEKAGVWTNPEIPQEFKLQGLQMIAENSNGSYRNAMQILQQCLTARTFTLNDIKENCGLQSIEDFYSALIDILEGKLGPSMFNTIINNDDYGSAFNLSMKVVSDAESLRLFRDVPGNSTFFKNQAAQLVSHSNYSILRDGMLKLQAENGAYMKKSAYIIGMCKIIDECKKALGPARTVAPTFAPTRRIISK